MRPEISPLGGELHQQDALRRTCSCLTFVGRDKPCAIAGGQIVSLIEHREGVLHDEARYGVHVVVFRADGHPRIVEQGLVERGVVTLDVRGQRPAFGVLVNGLVEDTFNAAEASP